MKYYLFSYSATRYDGTIINQCITVSTSAGVINTADAATEIARSMKYKVVIPFLFQEINEYSYNEFNKQFDQKDVR